MAGLWSLNLLPALALSAWTAVKMRRGHWWLVPAWLVLIVWGMYALDLPGETWVPVNLPPFEANIGPYKFLLPQEAFTFGAGGNILRTGGIDFFQYNQEPLWTPEAWRALWAVGVGLGALLLAKLTSCLFNWARERARKEPVRPVCALYLLGCATFATTVTLASYYGR